MAEAAFSRYGGITERKNARLAVGVSWRKDCLRAPIFRFTFRQTWSTWSFQDRLESTISPSNRVLLSKGIFFPSQVMFASDDSPATAFETPFDRWQINIIDVFSQLILSPLLYTSVEIVVSAVETSLQALFKEVLEQ